MNEFFTRREGEALHPDREPLEVLARLREVLGEYNFSGQYQQSPSPLGGGLVKTAWFKTYTPADVPTEFELVLQSWDTANKPTELSDYSVGTTWGLKDKHLFLLHMFRKRVGYPDLKRAVQEQARAFGSKVILIEDKASGTQLVQELVNDGVHGVTPYQTTMDKIMRLHSVTSTIENGFVHLPAQAEWLPELLHEVAAFPNGRYDDQVDSMSQALDWFKTHSMDDQHGVLAYFEKHARPAANQQASAASQPRPCSCNGVVIQREPGLLRCGVCGAERRVWDARPRGMNRFPFNR